MPTLNATEFSRRARRLAWILCDVDGVLTDGRLVFDREGPSHLVFHVRDGLALQLAQRAGLRVGIFSGRASAALERRVAELGLDASHTDIRDKQIEFQSFLDRHSLDSDRIAYIGDDLPDLVVLRQCGLSFAPSDAAPEVRQLVHRTLQAEGGRGAVREMVEQILRARGDWDRVVAPFAEGG